MKEKIKKIITIFFAFFCVLTFQFVYADSGYVVHELDNNPPNLHNLLKMHENASFKEFDKGNYFIVPRLRTSLQKDVLFVFFEWDYYIFSTSPSKVQIFDVEHGKRIFFTDGCHRLTANYHPITQKYTVSIYPAEIKSGRDIVIESTTSATFDKQMFTKPCTVYFFGNFLDIKYDEGIKQGNPDPPVSSPQGAGEGLTKYLPAILEFLVWFLSSLLGLHLSLKLLRKFTNISR